LQSSLFAIVQDDPHFGGELEREDQPHRKGIDGGLSCHFAAQPTDGVRPGSYRGVEFQLVVFQRR
jgi:hypothetical protein